MYARIYSFGIHALDGYKVVVEADISGGLPNFDVVGLPDNAVKESRDRVRMALKHLGFNFPNSRVTLNLAPSDIKKSGSHYDLPMLLAVMKCSGQLNIDLNNCGFVGEVSLNGEVRPVKGAISMAITAREHNITNLFVPIENANEAAAIDGVNVFPVKDIQSLIRHFNDGTIKKTEYKEEPVDYSALPDLTDVRGQPFARRALEIAAAGSHNMLMVGFPGSGKSMLAKRLPSILPPLTQDQSIEVTKIYSVAGLLPNNSTLMRNAPFRAPHHSISTAGLAGGGSVPRPGEISLSHHGVLFLDELAEYKREAIEVLRQPIEDGKVTVSRVAGNVTYPCQTIVVAAMNPCPCGYHGHAEKVCSCAPHAIKRYYNKLSGPLLDRIDLHIHVASVDFESLSEKGRAGESSAQVLERVLAARERQAARQEKTGVLCNAHLPDNRLRELCTLSEMGQEMLKDSFEQLNISARGYNRILKVARTIADLEGAESIGDEHLLEAIQYRNFDFPTDVTY